MRIKIDPTKNFSSVKQQYLLEACGLVLPWAMEWADTPVGSLSTYLGTRYQFPMYPIEGGSITEDHIFTYPDDPPAYPLVLIESHGATFLMYHHALVAIKDTPTSSFFITRMD